MLAFGQTEFMGIKVDLPEWINLKTLVLSEIIWITVPFLLAFWWFQKRDI
ncbi:MAG: hypothetical protein J7L88_02675 [Thermoplasmata archaeon]|nr:hypothetical protein [Thermoplasmata archaeon]